MATDAPPAAQAPEAPRPRRLPKLPGLPKLPLATLYLFSGILFVYYLSVNFLPFISPNYDILSSLGLHFNAPWSIFTYMFIHLWPSHLIVDALLLLVFGVIVENRVGGWKMLIIFLSSGFIGGLVNLFFFPTKILIGSSGAVFGLIGAAIVLHPFLSFSLFALSLNVFAPIVTIAVDNAEAAFVQKVVGERENLAYFDEALQEKIGALSVQREAVNRSLERTQDALQGQEESLAKLQADYRAGRVSRDTFEKLSAQLVSSISTLKANVTRNTQVMTLVSRDIIQAHQDRLQVATERVDVEEKAVQLEFSQQTREATPQAAWPHSVGLLVGAIALFALRKETFLEWEGKYDAITGFVLRKKPEKKPRP